MREASVSLPLGIVIRKAPGVTRWASWSWKAVAVLPGAEDVHWRELRREGDAVEYHAATVPLELWPTDTEAYLNGLSAKTPAICVVLSATTDPNAAQEVEVLLATASPYEAQDYLDSGEEIVELVPMPEGLVAFIRDFVEQHHEDEKFVKRKRDKQRVDLTDNGKGDPRISQISNVYNPPRRATGETVH